MEQQTFSADELAALLDCSERTVQRLARRGVLPKASHGRYPVAAVGRYIDQQFFGPDSPIAKAYPRLAQHALDRIEFLESRIRELEQELRALQR